jgi:hypothetical protein
VISRSIEAKATARNYLRRKTYESLGALVSAGKIQNFDLAIIFKTPIAPAKIPSILENVLSLSRVII